MGPGFDNSRYTTLVAARKACRICVEHSPGRIRSCAYGYTVRSSVARCFSAALAFFISSNQSFRRRPKMVGLIVTLDTRLQNCFLRL